MTSLIQQRIAIERLRTLALLGLSIGVAAMLVAIFVTLTDIGSWSGWALLAGSVAVVSVNIAAYLRAQRQLHGFEAEHGHGAGSQRDL
ncbi:hypothetical protein [Microbacterium sp. CGR1]|uniref:hypothetical protein n=1 Tax=Microbacterium sp. CGR1 TaxID=1696072 RepID=UPI003DA209EA